MTQQQPTKTDTPQSSAILLPPTTNSEVSAVRRWVDQGTQIVREISAFFTQLLSSIDTFWKQYQPLVWSIALLIGTIVGLRVIVAVIDALNDIPLVEPTFQVIGVGYSIWVVWRYLLKPSTRQELAQKLQSLLE